MEEVFETAELRERLITAGIHEIEAHGLTDFSLRRVANMCGASCAAPYKHFENKDGFILEIFRFINRQWALLEQQIVEIYAHDTRRLLLELCLANIRFQVANPHFRAVLALDTRHMDAKQRREIGGTLSKVTALAEQLCTERSIPTAAPQKAYILRSLIYGAAMMIGSGDLENSPETMHMIRATLEWELA